MDLAEIKAKYDASIAFDDDLKVIGWLIAQLEAAQAELTKAQQKAAGYKVDRCACVFGEEEDPVRECDYHKTMRAENERLKAALESR